MPQISFPLPTPAPAARDIPIVGAVGPVPLAGLDETLRRASDILDHISDEQRRQQDAVEYAQLQSEFDVQLRELSESVRSSEPDFQKREELYRKQAALLASNLSKQATSSRVKSLLQAHVARELPAKIFDFRVKNQGEWNKQRIATLDQLEDTLAQQIVETDDPNEASRHRGVYNAVLSEFSKGAYPALNPEQAEKRRQQFDEKVAEARSLRMIRQSPETYLALVDDDPELRRVSLEKRLKLMDTAQKRIDEIEKRRAQAAEAVSSIVLRMAHARANFGKLDDETLNSWMRDESNYIDPPTARRLKEINSNPPSSKWDVNVGAIMQEYYSGPITAESVNRARAALNALIRQQDAPSKAIADALRRLQIDQQSLESIETARMNRAIRDAEDEYDAQNTLPFSSPLFNQRAKRDKAKIATDIRRGRDPRPIIERKTRQNQQKFKSLSPEEKFMLGAE